MHLKRSSHDFEGGTEIATGSLKITKIRIGVCIEQSLNTFDETALRCTYQWDSALRREKKYF